MPTDRRNSEAEAKRKAGSIPPPEATPEEKERGEESEEDLRRL